MLVDVISSQNFRQFSFRQMIKLAYTYLQSNQLLLKQNNGPF